MHTFCLFEQATHTVRYPNVCMYAILSKTFKLKCLKFVYKINHVEQQATNYNSLH